MSTRRKYFVEWTATAEYDLNAILEFIAYDSPDQAMRILGKLQKHVFNLSIFPERDRVVLELKDQGIILYREMIISPWRVIYKISERTVYVLAVLDTRRNLEDILFDRFVG